jgi:hypothetical protein
VIAFDAEPGAERSKYKVAKEDKARAGVDEVPILVEFRPDLRTERSFETPQGTATI